MFCAYHGKGSWKSVGKLFYSDYKQIKEAIKTNKKTCWTFGSMENNVGYYTFQNAHVDCKKDNSKVLRNTTSPKIKDNINKNLNSRLLGIVIIDSDENETNYKTLLISKHSANIKIGEVHKDRNTNLHYEIIEPAADLIVSMQEYICSGKQDSKIFLDIPCLYIYATGDLAFYADVLGKPNRSTYWCHLCMLVWKEWNKDGHKKGELWSLEKVAQ